MLRRFFAFVGMIVISAPTLAQLPPDKALATMQVADGLQVELFAAEPMLINPTSIDVDHLGRVWVCEAVNYRRVMFNRPILRPEGDRIVILTDKDDDGKADESTVFYQGKEIIAPIGICVAPIVSPQRKQGSCRVFVCQSPDILLFEDLDGDGKADGPPKKFLTGFKGFDHDHGVHGINIGPDGKLYFTVGDAGVDGLKSSDGKGRVWKSNSTDVRAGTVWRCDIDGKNLELIAHNFRNNYECCVNSFGEIWLSDNDDDGNQQTRICHVMPGGNYGYHPRGQGQTHWHEEQPGIVHKVIRTGFGSPTGICFYEGTLLPKKYHGQLLHTDAGPRELRVFHLKPKGAGYEAEKEVLLTSTDNWFRPSDVCVAPDGSLIVADWYDPGVGGHGMGDTTRGRIYRVTPKGHKGYKVAKVDVETNEGFMGALASPCLAVRHIATEKISAIGVNGVHNDLIRQSQDAKQLPNLRALAYWQAGRMKLAGSSYWLDFYKGLKMQTETDARLREMAIRIQRDCFNQTPERFISHANTAWDTDVKTDRAATVRREALLALQHRPSDEHVREMFVGLAKQYDGQDRFYLAALNIACGTDPERRAKILADFDKHFPELNDKTLDLIWELRPPGAVTRLEKQLGDAKLTAAQRGRIVDILASSDDPAAGKTMLKLVTGNAPAEVKARALENLKLFLPTKWKSLQNSKETSATIDQMLKEPATQITGLQLIAMLGAVDRVKDVIKLTGMPDLVFDFNNETQTEAVRTLGKLKTQASVDALRVEARLATVNPSPGARTASAIHGLGAMISGQPNDTVGAKAMAVLQELVATDSLGGWHPRRELALEVLAGSRPGTDWLLKLKEDGKMPEPLVGLAGRLLRNSPFQGQRNKALILFPPPGKLDPKKLPAIATLAKRSGNAENGRKLMAASAKNEAQCLKCHTIRGVGGAVGPDLSMIGKKAAGRENLLESLLNPSKAIADQYIQWQIETKNGLQFVGLLIEESPDSILLRDANAKDHRIAKKDIESRTKSQASIMPDNIVAAFTEDEMLDVVEYMLTLRTASLTPDTWHVVGPFSVPSMAEGVDKVFEVEKFPFTASDTFTESGQRKAIDAGFLGKLHWKAVRIDQAGYLDLAALHGQAANNSVSYAYRIIESPVEQNATVLLGSDDGCKLWVNGEVKLTEKATRAAAPEQSRVSVRLKKGANTILLKVANGNIPHGFYLSVLADEELKAGK